MTPERWAQIKSLFAGAQERSGEDRRVYLDDVCGEDTDLRQEVESLLREREDVSALHSPVNSEDWSNRTISHYRVIEKIGAGGMGVVYNAEDTKLRRTVALKLPPAGATGDPEAQARFLKEAEAAAALDHPNITTIYEAGEESGQSFIAMAFVDGKTLAEKIAERPLPLAEALEIASQVAAALEAAHELGVVHRDIKPGNIMLTPKGAVKVMDFGLAHLSGQTRITKTGAIMGTPAYMSPEQAQGQPANHRSDIFSLGVVLYEMLTGRLPFRGENDQAVIYAIISQEPEPPTALRTGLPTELDHIVAKMLAKNAAERYQHADELITDLKRVRTHKKFGASAPVSPTGGAPKPATLAVGALLLLATGFGIATLVNRPGNTANQDVSQLVFRQLTFNPGLQLQPAISPDGKLVAYASDEAGEGNLDIWVLQVADHQARQLTFTPANESEPSFSPDGSRIVYRSDGEGGGISVISAQGGEPRPVTTTGQRPRFSPDGGKIAYWIGQEHMPGTANASVYVTPVEGGEPQRLGQGRSPVWSPDGAAVLALASAPASKPSWRVLPVDGDEPIQTGVFREFQRVGLRGGPGVLWGSPPLPDSWLPDGRVLFSAGTGESQDVWSVRISPESGTSLGDLSRITIGSGSLRHVSVSSSGRIAISSIKENADIWLLHGDANRADRFGSPKRLTTDTTTDQRPQLSLDGKHLLYRRSTPPDSSVEVTDLDTGRRRSIGPITGSSTMSVLRPDGKDIITAVPKLREISVMPFFGPGRKRLCEDVHPWITDVSTDGTWILSYAPPTALNAGTCEEQRLAEAGGEVRFSPDNRWVAFHTSSSPGPRRVYVIPFDPTMELPKQDWIPIPDSSTDSYRADWSPDGRLIYFGSDKDGYRCLYAQPVDPETKRPNGEVIEVFHSHSVGLTFGPNPGPIGLSVARDKIAVSMIELTGDIWLLERLEGTK